MADLPFGSGKSLTSLNIGHYTSVVTLAENVGAPTFKVILEGFASSAEATPQV
jgi:hypothetical protein